ncbi:DUF2637 domain-containing protein [Mycolicibacterium wolinskyi]|uniref:DUF2637 domain-containing protein n=1 Tax=Mycolicibacterium wolinskyi TaxID=59750 RepID=UPI0039176F3B
MNADHAARRFFWTWLLGSAAVSILGVVAHAILGSARSPVIASVLAFVIVMIQLCATYGVHVLVQARIVGAAYRCALIIVVALALGAFVLNFIALQDLVITWAGIAPVVAWIAPLIIDLGMTGSTVALLALTNAQRAAQLHMQDTAAADILNEVIAPADDQPVACEETPNVPVHNGAHLAIAQRLVTLGVVRIAPERVAEVLAEQSAGTAPSMIARRLGVGYSTVTRILKHQEATA